MSLYGCDSCLPPGLSHDQRSRHRSVTGVWVRKLLGGRAPKTIARVAHPALMLTPLPLLPLRGRSLPACLAISASCSLLLCFWSAGLCFILFASLHLQCLDSALSTLEIFVNPLGPNSTPFLHAPPGWRVSSPQLGIYMLYNVFRAPTPRQATEQRPGLGSLAGLGVCSSCDSCELGDFGQVLSFLSLCFLF